MLSTEKTNMKGYLWALSRMLAKVLSLSSLPFLSTLERCTTLARLERGILADEVVGGVRIDAEEGVCDVGIGETRKMGFEVFEQKSILVEFEIAPTLDHIPDHSENIVEQS